jgi:hypothetical protein
VICWSLVGSTAWFLALWVLDFPKPMMDDLAYIGAGLNLAAGGDYSNPFLAGQGFPSHYFFVHTPLASYALAGWLKVFGISASSVTGFQMAAFLAVAASTLAILRRHGAPVWLEWVVPLAVSAGFLRGGLRTEPLAAALTMAGFAWFECGRKGTFAVFGSFLLMFLGVSVSPRMGGISMALAGICGWGLWRSRAAAKERWRDLCMTALAALLTGLTFLIMIRFRLREFLITFHFHASGALAREGTGLWSRVHFFLESLGVTDWPLLLLALILIPFRMGQPPDEMTAASIAICAALPVTLVFGLLGFGSGWYLFLLLLFAVPGLVRNATRARSVSVAVALLFVGFAGNSKPLVNIFGDLNRQIKEGEGGDRAAALALQPGPGPTVLVDVCAARYAFDYRIPQGFLSFEFGARFPRYLILDVEFPREDIFVLGPDGVNALRKRGLREETAPRWSPFGGERWAFYRYPRKTYVIPASSCTRR